jgi:drug/metabolite transporter (DMT)-like permease
VTERAHRWPGVPLALASSLLFGASVPFAKLLLGITDPWLLAGLLYLGAGLGLSLVILGRRTLGLPPPEAPIRRSDLPLLMVVVLIGGAAGPLLLMLGLARTEAASASLLLNLENLATMGLAWLVFGENVDRRLLIGAFSIVAGAALLSWQGQGVSLNPGALLIMAACFAWATDNNLTRKLSGADPVLIALIKGWVAGIINLILSMTFGARLPVGAAIPAAMLIGFLGYGLSLVLFVLGLRHLGAARTGAYFSSAPFIGALLAVVLLGEELSPRLLLAGALMGIGLLLHLLERHEHEHTHDPIEHEHRHIHDAHHQHTHEPGISLREPHSHWHRHERLVHRHPHYPDLHHQHGHRAE